MNVVAMTGKLAAEPTRRETAKGVLATFRLGSDDSPRVWVDVECWGRLAERCAAHLRRGRHVAVTGSLGRQEWTDQAGQRRHRWLVKASAVTFLDRPAHLHGGAAFATPLPLPGAMLPMAEEDRPR